MYTSVESNSCGVIWTMLALIKDHLSAGTELPSDFVIADDNLSWSLSWDRVAWYGATGVNDRVSS